MNQQDRNVIVNSCHLIAFAVLAGLSFIAVAIMMVKP